MAETQAIKTRFGEHAYETMVNSTKSMIGHLLGAAGGVEAIFTAIAMHISVISADDQPRQSERRLRSRLRTEHRARHRRSTVALSNSFGFGGTNGTLIFRKIH